jgi:hypothetical protein
MNAGHSDRVASLKEAYSRAWPPTLRFIDWAEKQQTTPRETFVDDLRKALKISGAEAAELVRGIVKEEIGSRIVGRPGSKTRIAWLYALKSVARVARGSSNTLEPLENSFVTRAGQLTHSFRLRPDYELKLVLPRDLTKAEALRIASFVQTLPFES